MSAASRVLKEMLRQVRDHTVRLLRATPSAWLTWSPPGTQNHILWHAGHALWIQDELWVRRLTGTSELPDTWLSLFGMQCQTHHSPPWPSARLLGEQLEQQRDRMLSLLAEVPPAVLEVARTPQPSGSDLVSGLIHGLHDEARHNGEMYLLFKLCRARHGDAE